MVFLLTIFGDVKKTGFFPPIPACNATQQITQIAFGWFLGRCTGRLPTNLILAPKNPTQRQALSDAFVSWIWLFFF